MPLSPATRLGPYEIISSIGTGGMGEVYKARDPRLSRDVALKVLNSSVAPGFDLSWQRRFEQEARAASALNHPNILTVYDIGTENGTSYIVTEFVDGETLRKSIGALSMRKVIDLATQIADGLAAAHQAGITHRDLKPENIMLTREGRVKILDFGLARLAQPQDGDATQTVEGMILGTVGYMSPEQARGQDLDFRSDQFSFGLVLFEMATGQRAFQRETPVQTLSAIISEETPPIPTVAAPVRWIIERCLAKEPAQRYGATIDLHYELRNLREHFTEVFSPEVPAATSRLPAGKKWFVAAGALVVALAAMSLYSRWKRSPGAADFASYIYTPLATDSRVESFPSWSTDGRTLAYSAGVDEVYQVFTRSLDSPMPSQITKASSDCLFPFWSPSGSRIYYISGRPASLWSVGAAGGEPELVVRNVTNAAISPDGATLAFLREQDGPGVWLSSATGAEPRKFADLPAGSGFVRFSPNGKNIGIWVGSSYVGDQFWVFAYPGSGGSGQRISKSWEQQFEGGPKCFSWMPDSRHFVFEGRSATTTDRHIWASDLDSTVPRPVTVSTGGEIYPAVSPEGKRMAFVSVEPDFDLVEIPLNGGQMRTLLSTPRYESWPAWSPRGSQIAYSTTRSGAYEIWLRSVSEGWDRPLVTAKDFPNEPSFFLTSASFSPEGRRLAYTRLTPSGGAIWISTVEGGPPVRAALEPEALRQDSPTWSPDGNWVAFLSTRKGKVLLAKAKVGGRNPPLDLKEARGLQVCWSPRGDWIAYTTEEGLEVVSPDGGASRRVSTTLPLTFGWAQDGSLLYVVRTDSKRRLLLASLNVETSLETVISDLGPLPLSSAPHLFGSSLRSFSMAPDGKSFAASLLRSKANIWMLEGFKVPQD